MLCGVAPYAGKNFCRLGADSSMGAAAGATGRRYRALAGGRDDRVITTHDLEEPGGQGLLDLLRQPLLQRRVDSLGGYDVSSMGLTVSDN